MTAESLPGMTPAGARAAGSLHPPPATVVVCVYTEDRWVTLSDAVEAVQQQMISDDELLVIVDHNDALLTRCRRGLDSCRVIPNRHSRGLSGARNTAIEEACGSIVIFIDDDAVPQEGWLNALRSPYADEAIYGVGGITTPRWPRSQPRWFPDEFLWVVGCSHLGLPPDRHAIRNLTGANMSFRKSVCRDLGGFAESMGRVGDRPLGCEETELSIRLTKENPDAVLLYEPAAQVQHFLALERSSVTYFARRCWGEGLSKAELARRVGRSSALSAERHYASRVLTRGVWHGVRTTLRGDAWGLARSAAILFGLAVTSAGYCVGAASSCANWPARLRSRTTK